MSGAVDAFDPTRRFSTRVAEYVRYRPRYPAAVLETLIAEAGLTPDSVVADIGSGTGFSAEMFLAHGNRVYGVEPNAEMRQAGEEVLSAWPRFVSVAGTAEATTLADASVDLVTAGQAFHWFDIERASTEFARILRPGGWLALFWNTRDNSASGFMAHYEEVFVRYGNRYKEVYHSRLTDGDIAAAFLDGRFERRNFAYEQSVDLEGLIGRSLSSSYMPAVGTQQANEVASALKVLFSRHAVGGRVTFTYVTELYFGHAAATFAV
jgi:SAM-dependent methyltransferase